MSSVDFTKLRSCDENLFVQVTDPRRYAVNLIGRCVQQVFYLYGLYGSKKNRRIAAYIMGRVGCKPFFAKVVSEPEPRVYIVFAPGIGRVLVNKFYGQYGAEVVIPLFIAEADGLLDNPGVSCYIEDSETLNARAAVCRRV